MGEPTEALGGKRPDEVDAEGMSNKVVFEGTIRRSEDRSRRVSSLRARRAQRALRVGSDPGRGVKTQQECGKLDTSRCVSPRKGGTTMGSTAARESQHRVKYHLGGEGPGAKKTSGIGEGRRRAKR